MARWIVVGKGGILAVGRVVAVARANSAPIRRLVEAVGRERVVDMTFGQPRRAVVVLDSGHIVTVSLTPETLLRRIEAEAEVEVELEAEVEAKVEVEREVRNEQAK